ncbi:MAG: glycosyltransferase family 4 protein [Gemmatimonadales bacterium]
MLYTRYPHWGRHAGFTQLISRVDRQRFAVRAQGASDSDRDLPIPHAGLRRRLRERVQASGMAWYKLSDLAAELRALPGCLLSTTDLVHFLDAEHSGQFLPRWIRRYGRSRTRTIATFHQPPELLDGLLDPEVVARFDVVTLVSPTQEAWFRAVVPPERIRVILHGVDCDFFRPADRIPDQRFRCLTVGHWLRDWPTVRGVAERLASEPDVELHVVTDRPTGLEGLPNVVRHRQVDDETLRALYQRADLLLLPLTSATANNAILEGLASGLPILSTRLPAIEAYAPGPEAILVEGGDSDRLAEAVLRLRDGTEERGQRAAAARRRAEALSWSTLVKRYEALYDEVIRS